MNQESLKQDRECHQPMARMQSCPIDVLERKAKKFRDHAHSLEKLADEMKRAVGCLSPESAAALAGMLCQCH